MLTHPQAQPYSAEDGLRNIMIAENEIVFVYLLQLNAEEHILDMRPTGRSRISVNRRRRSPTASRR